MIGRLPCTSSTLLLAFLSVSVRLRFSRALNDEGGLAGGVRSVGEGRVPFRLLKPRLIAQGAPAGECQHSFGEDRYLRRELHAR
jgi:hypothetical protein